MVLYYIQTWVISDGLIDVHDDLLEIWLRYMVETFNLVEPIIISPPEGPEGGRCLVFEFVDAEDFYESFKAFFQDDINMEYLEQWINFIRFETFRVTFWGKQISSDQESG